MPPFVGRQPELAVLRARLTAALAGQPQVVRIEGPAGIGKTALIEHFLRDPGVSPAPVVVRASGEDTESLLAYGVVEQLARAAGASGAALLGALPAGGAHPGARPGRRGQPHPGAAGRAGRRLRCGAGGRRRALGRPAVGAGAGVRPAPAGRRPGADPARGARGCRRAAAGDAAPAGQRASGQRAAAPRARRAGPARPGRRAGRRRLRDVGRATAALRHPGQPAARQGAAGGVPAQ